MRRGEEVFSKREIAPRGAIQPWLVTLLSALLLLGLVSGFGAKLGGNAGSFICAGDQFIPPEKLSAAGVPYFKNSAGYDGQFFYLIAHDPWILGDQFKYIDNPGYRYQRIFYPLLVHGTAGGDPRNFPERLVQINFVAILLGVFFMARFLISRGRSSLWAFVFAVLGGNILGLFRDLSDPLALTLALLAFLFYEGKCFWRSALFLSLALLTREIFFPVGVLMVLDQGFKRHDWKKASICAMPLLPFFFWQGYVALHLKAFLCRAAGSSFTFPFLGLVHKIFSGCGLSRDSRCLSAFVLVMLLTLWSAVREVRRSPDAVSLSFLFFSMLPVIGSQNVWPEPWAYGRLLLPSAGMLLFCYGRSGRRQDWIPLALNLVASGAVLRWLFRN